MTFTISSKKIVSLLMAAVMLLTVAACGKAPETSPEATTAPADSTEAPETEPKDKFDGIDLNGVTIRVQTSVNMDDATNANFLIEGTGSLNGDVANDAVFKRNTDVEELLNVKLKYIQSNETWRTSQDAVQKIVLAGDDAYDVIIQDLFPMASLAVDGLFLNVADQEIIDLSQPYWWNEYMTDLSLGRNSAMYILAGDYFMDVLCSAHALFFNKSQLKDITGDPDVLYNLVLDGKWTIDELIKYMDLAYNDLNGNGTPDEGDNFGYICGTVWGSGIPFYVCGDLKFITRDGDGVPSYTLDKDPRAATALVKMDKLFYGKSMFLRDNTAANRAYFSSGKSLFVGYHRVGQFDLFRDVEFDIGILPYPKLDAEQEHYVTSTHDTTEVGVIPVTNTKLETTCTVIEALCRETHKTVLPAYYETTLKVKYARDDVTSQMIDIIHDNLRSSFPLAYNGYLDGALLTKPFRTPLENHSTNFASTMASAAPEAQAKLAKMIETYNSKAK
ncbi:MAG: hypothetical protein IKQ87_03820 [Clostridia bacterium]|nr:hypothetical protein [Clostridia bacterium]